MLLGLPLLVLPAAALFAQETPAPESAAATATAQPAAEAPAAATPAKAAPPARAASQAPKPAARPTPAEGTAAAPAPRRAPTAAGSDPVAVLGVLDKRLGTSADFTLKPGDRFTFGRLSGTLRSCERTQPFERPQSAAFVQLVEQPPARAGQPAPKPVSRFSGWLFAESPSLNPFMHPVYDVWLKSCTMRFPDGPKPPAASSGKPMPGSARKAPAAKAPAATTG
jgi:hypothetical protein